MIEKHIYIAYDGKEFANRDACEIYETMLCNKKIKEELAGLPNIKKAMSVISEYCTSHACCDECLMLIRSPERCCYFRDNSPNNWLEVRIRGK